GAAGNHGERNLDRAVDLCGFARERTAPRAVERAGRAHGEVEAEARAGAPRERAAHRQGARAARPTRSTRAAHSDASGDARLAEARLEGACCCGERLRDGDLADVYTARLHVGACRTEEALRPATRTRRAAERPRLARLGIRKRLRGRCRGSAPRRRSADRIARTRSSAPDDSHQGTRRDAVCLSARALARVPRITPLRR